MIRVLLIILTILHRIYSNRNLGGGGRYLLTPQDAG